MSNTPLIYENVFGTSTQRTVSAEKIGVSIGCMLFNEAWNTRIEGTTQKVGTKITIVTTLYDEYGHPLNGKAVDIYHRLGTGAWEKIRTVTIGTTSDHGTPSSGGADIYYTLSEAGTHTFYADFPGDDTYAGCGKAAKSFAR